MIPSIVKSSVHLSSIEGVEQRCQLLCPDVNWEICWDTNENRIVAWDSMEVTYEITASNISNNSITISDVLESLGYTEVDYKRSLEWCRDNLDLSMDIKDVLAAPVSTVIIHQILCTLKSPL
jgi:hypothetical protein